MVADPDRGRRELQLVRNAHGNSGELRMSIFLRPRENFVPEQWRAASFFAGNHYPKTLNSEGRDEGESARQAPGSGVQESPGRRWATLGARSRAAADIRRALEVAGTEQNPQATAKAALRLHHSAAPRRWRPRRLSGRRL